MTLQEAKDIATMMTAQAVLDEDNESIIDRSIVRGVIDNEEV